MASGPLGFVAMVLFYCAWPKAEYLPTIQRRSWKDMDFLGSFLVIAASVLVTFAFQNAGTNETDVNPWAKGTFIGPLVVGVVCWAALFAWEGAFERLWSRKMAAIPLVLMRNHVFAAATLNTIFLGFAYLATLYAVPLRLQVVNGKSPIMAGVLMLPMLGATGIGSVISGIVSKKQNRLSETMTVATMMVTLGLALETTVSDSQELQPKFLGFLAFIGLGYGMITSSATMFTAIEAPIPEHGKSQEKSCSLPLGTKETDEALFPAPAQGIIAQSRMLGGSIGIAMSSAVLAVQQRAQLAGMVSPSELQNLGSMSMTEAQRAAVRKTYNDSFTTTMKVCAIVAGIGILLTLGTLRRGRVPLLQQREKAVQEEIERRRLETNHKGTTSSKASDRSA